MLVFAQTVTYVHPSFGAACPRASWAYIRQSTLACIITYTYITLIICAYVIIYRLKLSV